jgi:23S rRNA (uridine2552-2'-O)-methyltransferase
MVKDTSGRGQRDLRVRVKTARGRKLSSTLWLERQLNDPYVRRARAEGYRGRAAFKILELDDKFGFLVPGARVVDLGCAPGGWCQVAVQRINALGARKTGKPVGRIIGIDLQDVESIAGAEIHKLDFLEDGADEKVKEWLGGKADVVMSDMAAASSGHKQTDHLRIVALCEAAAQFAFDVLEPGGTFVAKVLSGGAEGGLQTIEAALRHGRECKAAGKPVRQFREIRDRARVSRLGDPRARRCQASMLSGDLPLPTASLYQPGWRPRPDHVSDGLAGLRNFTGDLEERAAAFCAADDILHGETEFAGDFFHRLASLAALAILERGNRTFDIARQLFQVIKRHGFKIKHDFFRPS